jgi:hypothetical protein
LALRPLQDRPIFYLEGGSEDHLMSSTGKYCVRELAAA